MPLNIKGNIIETTDITNRGVFKKRVNTEGLIAYFDAGNLNSYPGSGAVWYDLSGNGNNGTLYNSPTWNSSEGSFSFNGSTQYMQANVSTTTLDGDPKFTIEMMVKRTATLTASSGGYWGLGGAGTNLSFEGWTPTDNLIHLDCYSSTRTSSQQLYPLNTFVHVVWVKHNVSSSNNNNSVICYINGVAATLANLNAGSTANLNTSSAGKGIAIGRINGDASTYYAQCNMGFFRVYDRALSSFEVSENFQAQKVRYGL